MRTRSCSEVGSLSSLTVCSVCVLDLEACHLNSSVSVCSADLCRDQFSRCGVAALSGQCSSLGGSCGKSCGGC